MPNPYFAPDFLLPYAASVFLWIACGVVVCHTRHKQRGIDAHKFGWNVPDGPDGIDWGPGPAPREIHYDYRPEESDSSAEPRVLVGVR